MARVFPNKLNVGDKFKTKDNIYTCVSTRIYIQINNQPLRRWSNPRVLKKKIPKNSILVREIILKSSRGSTHVIKDINPAGKPKWINEQRFNIIDEKGKLRVGYHISFTKID